LFLGSGMGRKTKPTIGTWYNGWNDKIGILF